MDEDCGVTEFELGDPLAMRCGNTLTGVFLPSGKIALSAYRHVKWNTRDVPTETAGEDPVIIHMIHETTIFEEPVLRSLLAESSTSFATLQSLGQKASKSEYMRVSCTYRSVIRAGLEKLEHVKKTPEVQTDELRLQRISEGIAVFYVIECLWHLFEILFLQQHNQHVLAQLLEWTRFHFPHTEDRATDLMLAGTEASEADDYWTVLKKLVMLGDLDVARAILLQNRKVNRAAFQIADTILKTMPQYKDGYVLQKFCSQWEFWRADLKAKVEANAFASEPELELIMQLMMGSNEHWDANLQDSESWYQFFPGYLLYTNPACKQFELRNAVTNWINRWTRLHSDWEMNNLSRMIMLLMEHDVKQFLYDIQKINDSHWFATHLLDLIYQSGQLHTYCNPLDLPHLRNFMVYEFGCFLMSSNNLWQLGIDYLDSCKQEGSTAIELLLSRIPLRTERQALKIIAVAKKRNMFGVEQEICKVLSRRAYNDERYGNALEWAIRSKDLILVTSIADFILKNYSNTGTMLCPNVISTIGARMFISPRLVFLSKYFEFYEFYRKRNFVSAAELLVNLLDSKITPDYFWPSLLIDAVPLLESKDPMIFSKETVAILRHLEMELVPLMERNKRDTATFANKTSKTMLKDYRVENVEEILELLRLACARNLARALVIENSAALTSSVL